MGTTLQCRKGELQVRLCVAISGFCVNGLFGVWNGVWMLNLGAQDQSFSGIVEV